MAKNQIFFGRNVLEEAVRSGVSIGNVYVGTDSARKFAQSLGFQRLNGAIPRSLKDENHQGIAFESDHNFYGEGWPEEIPPMTLLCNHLEDVGNFGAMIRSAAAFGCGLIVHETRRSVRVTPSAVKISSGMAFKVKFFETENLLNVVQHLSKEGAEVATLEQNESTDLYKWNCRKPAALVVGSESEGISKPLQKFIETRLSIPMEPNVESLNAAHSVSIALSYFYSHQ